VWGSSTGAGAAETAPIVLGGHPLAKLRLQARYFTRKTWLRGANWSLIAGDFVFLSL
jgi:hypothetical protein